LQCKRCMKSRFHVYSSYHPKAAVMI
jgi:hypothetical protein